MKGTVYTGVCYFPRHPQADMHGLVRCIVRTSSLQKLQEALAVYDIPFHVLMFNEGIWCESKSVVEKAVSETHYGEVMVCALSYQYLGGGHYETVPKGLKVSQVVKAQRPLGEATNRHTW
jgi:hypothetical protein